MGTSSHLDVDDSSMVGRESEVAGLPVAAVPRRDRAPATRLAILSESLFNHTRTRDDDGETSMARSFNARPFIPSDSAACSSMSLARRTHDKDAMIRELLP